MMLCHQVCLLSSSHPTLSPRATDHLVKAIRSAPRRHNLMIDTPQTENEALTNMCFIGQSNEEPNQVRSDVTKVIMIHPLENKLVPIMT